MRVSQIIDAPSPGLRDGIGAWQTATRDIQGGTSMTRPKPGPRPQPQPRAQPRPQQGPPHAQGWYADGSGKTRWHDGYQWSEHTTEPEHGVNRGVMIGVAVGLVVLGAILNLSSVSLLTGTDKVWIGVGLIALALLFCFVPRRLPAWTIAVVAVVLALAIANAAYDEVQLEHKRQELEQLIH